VASSVSMAALAAESAGLIGEIIETL